MQLPAALVASALCCTGAAAATFSVTTTGDGGAGSLRQAILDANERAATAPAEANTIRFAIPGNGPFTIATGLQARLPNLRGRLTIDGYSQAGSARNTLTPDQGGLDTVLQIEIKGPGNGFGFVLDTGMPVADVTLRGLTVNGYGPHVGGGNADSRLQVQGSFIGTTVDGMAAVPSVSMACISMAGSLRIGGTEPAERNLIANCGNGAIVAGNGDTVIEGNLIGTDARGERQLPGSAGTSNNAGVIVTAASNATPSLRIGGVSAASRNVISGHRTAGIALYGSAPFAAYSTLAIVGNFIGTDWSGTRAIPNGLTEAPQFSAGIVLSRTASDHSAVVIGGFAPGEANLIAYNHGSGILAREARDGESFDNRGNVIHHNRGVGADIDIGTRGPTPDDVGDPDEGANNRQNGPQILAAHRIDDRLVVTYRVDSTTTASTYPLRIDVHENVQGGSGALLGQDFYPAASAQQARTIALTIRPGVRALPFVATATDANGYSSEFSPAFDVLFENDFE